MNTILKQQTKNMQSLMSQNNKIENGKNIKQWQKKWKKRKAKKHINKLIWKSRKKFIHIILYIYI